MFDFCVRHLRMTEGEAYRRILAARLSTRFPVILDLLASGAVHLSALQLLGDRLTDENHAELLQAASGKTKREVEQMLAARFPKPDVPTTIRKLPDRRTDASRASNQTPVPEQIPVPAQRRAHAHLEPLSRARYRLQLTVSESLRDKLELARDLMSHANPTRDLEPLLGRALDLLIGDLEKKKLARTQRPRKSELPDRATRSRRVPAAARRDTFERDGLQCTYVSPSGRRCTSRAFLELDHVDPRGRGGSNDAGNLRVRCSTHNQLWAEQSYGRNHVDRARHFSQEKSKRGQTDDRAEHDRRVDCDVNRAAEPHATHAPGVARDIAEKARGALAGLGYRKGQARRAVDEIVERYAGELEVLSAERVLVEALWVLDGRR
jgi:5-methylcytosine-specific restriction endonuclease McrA